MSNCKTVKSCKILIFLTVFLLVIGLSVGGFLIYASDYYRADAEAIAAFADLTGISKTVYDDGTAVYQPEDAKAGFIFYPGGKVEYTAYEPLMVKLAERGVLCVLVKMPFNLAVLDVNAADGIPERFPDIERWYIGGHSLGGSMAASYLNENRDVFSGLVLLGSYSTADLSDSGIDALSVYGSEDGVMNRDKYAKHKGNLPDTLRETVIQGGNHAYFGMYGRQDGDKEASITNEEQITVTADAVLDMIFGK